MLGDDVRAVHCGGADGKPGALVDCLSPAIAHISSPLGFGSGVVLDSKYVVTNAHVVAPFDHVTVTTDGHAHEDVPVVGIIPLDDIAVVGPIPDVDRATSLSDSRRAAIGTPVFLVGFPIDFAVDPEPTITGGILSRRQTLAEFGLTYLESDATIGHGQSGGALVDGDGHVLGISGLGSEGFAFSLSSEDVADDVEKILDGKGDDPGPFLTKGGDKDGEFKLQPFDPTGGGFGGGFSFDVALVAIAPADKERTVEFSIDPFRDIAVETIVLNRHTPVDVEDLATGDFGFGFDAADESTDGEFSVDLREGDGLLITFAGSSPRTIEYESNFPMVLLGPLPPEEATKVEVGDTVHGTTDLFGRGQRYVLKLDEGERVDIRAGSPTADVEFVVVGSGPRFEVDDSGEGLFGTDPHRVFIAPTSATYTINVSAFSSLPSGYVLILSEA